MGGRVAADSVKAGIGAQKAKHPGIVISLAAIMELHHPSQSMILSSKKLHQMGLKGFLPRKIRRFSR